MKIFIDTANIDEIEEAFSWGFVDGITTNPSLIKKAVKYYKNKGQNITLENYVKNLLVAAGKDHPVSLEVIGNTEDTMYEEGKLLFKKFNDIAQNVIIKIPVNPETSKNGTHNFDGLKAIKKLSADGIPVNCTLVMTPSQALLAAKAGARYVSPFAGRIDDYLRFQNGTPFTKPDYYPKDGLVVDDKILHDNTIVSGVNLVQSIVDIFENYDFATEIIAASIRNATQAQEIARTGADIATIPFPVLKEMIFHHKTKEGMEKFTNDTIEEYKNIFK